MSDQEWMSVTNRKARKRRVKQQRKRQLETLKEQCPHLVTPQHAVRLARRLNIDNLAEKLQSTEWIELQLEGWYYKQVLTNPDTPVPEDDDTHTYCVKPVNNSYGDRVLFQRPLLPKSKPPNSTL